MRSDGKGLSSVSCPLPNPSLSAVNCFLFPEKGIPVQKRITVIPGDGIGREVVEQALLVLKKIEKVYGHRFEAQEALAGGAALDVAGVPLPAVTLDRCRQSHAVLLGALGGPKWDANPPGLKPENGLLGLREGLGLYANLRPARIYPPLANASTLKKEVVEGVDLLIVRELTGGIYFGKPRGISLENGEEVGVNTEVYRTSEIKRIATVAFEAARKRRRKLTSVDKQNVLEVLSALAQGRDRGRQRLSRRRTQAFAGRQLRYAVDCQSEAV